MNAHKDHARHLSCQIDNTLDLDSIVGRLAQADRAITRHAHCGACALPLPSTAVVNEIMETLRAVVFPGYFGSDEPSSYSLSFHLGHAVDKVRRSLREQITRCICFTCDGKRPQRDCADEAGALTDRFLVALPGIQQMLFKDAQAAYEGDPAASSPDEAIFCYPGMNAMTTHRVAHALFQMGVPLLPRMLSELAHSGTGIDIHPGARIGESFFIDHGTGVVIGETCRIGKHVQLYQGVTLGAKSFPLDENGNPIKGVDRHPILEDRVTVYAGATILGRVTIGEGSVIGGNEWLTRSVAPGSRISQAQPHREKERPGG